MHPAGVSSRARQQRELDREQSLVDLDQSIAEREQARADGEQHRLDEVQLTLDATGDPGGGDDSARRALRAGNSLRATQPRLSARLIAVGPKPYNPSVRELSCYT